MQITRSVPRIHFKKQKNVEGFYIPKKIFCLDAEATESQFTAVEIFETCRVTSVVFKKKKK